MVKSYEQQLRDIAENNALACKALAHAKQLEFNGGDAVKETVEIIRALAQAVKE